MKVIASVLIFLCLCSVASAEDWDIVYNSAESQIYCLESFDGSIYAGAYSNGTIYKSSNGIDWTVSYDSTEVSITSLKSFNGSIYAGTNPNGMIYKSSNGVDWTVAYDSTETSILSLESFDGFIYAGTLTNGLIYRSSNGIDWVISNDTTESRISCLKEFNGSIYAGTNPNGMIYKSSNGVDWTVAYDSTETSILSLESFDGFIYAGTYSNGTIYKSSNGIDWVTSTDTTETYIFSLESFNNSIYAGAYGNGMIYKSSNGIDWVISNDTTEEGIKCLKEFNGSIYAGTQNNGLIYQMTPYIPPIPPPTSYISIDHYEQSPDTMFTNYTGLLTSSFLINSSSALNYSSLAHLFGMNYTLTNDYRAYLKVPANSIADGVYRAHNRNTTPLMWWEDNNTITEGNIWKWCGGVYGMPGIATNSINATHTFINITGVTSNVFPASFYLNRDSMYEATKTPIEINKAQGIIFKIWDVDQFRSRNNDYFMNLYFDTQLEATPDASIDIWYCNDSFNPNTDDPCLVCDYKDSWDYNRWVDHETWQPDNNVSYAKPLSISANISTCSCPPTEINYIYLCSNTVSSKAYILNATNIDPGICNLTFAQTNSMWLRNEIAGTNTPYAYTPSFYITFVRDYLQFEHHLYISNMNGTEVHSDIYTTPIGVSNYNPTHCRYNYFWWNVSTDYNMTGTYTEDFYANITLGFDPDNGADLTHVMSLYNENNVFVATINSSINGSNNDIDIFIDTSSYRTNGIQYYFHILSTDNEDTTSTSMSPLFRIEQDYVSKFAGTKTLLEGIPSAFQDTIDEFIKMLPFMIALAMLGFLGFIIIFVTGSLKKW